MNVVIAIHHFPPKYVAGAEKETYQIAKGLQKRGHQVHVICVEDIHAPADTWEDTLYDGIPVRRMHINASAFADPERYEYDNPVIGKMIQASLREFQPDVFHLVSGYLITGSAIHAAKQLGIPTVVSLMDFWFLCKRITMLRSDGSLSNLPIDPAACVQCLGEQQRRYRLPGKVLPDVMTRYWKMQTGRIEHIEQRMEFQKAVLNQANLLIGRSKFLRSTYIQAGVDPAHIVFSRQGFQPSGAELSPSPKSVAEALRIGYIGQIVWHKGVHTLIEAVKQLKDLPVCLDIYGDRQAFPKYARQLQDRCKTDPRISLLGVISREQVSKVLANLDVLVVPSLWYENSPNVILEAFAQKTPVITSNIGGMAELVEHGVNGLHFQVGDADDLAKQLKYLHDHRDVLAEYQKHFPAIKTVDAEIDELTGFYQRVMAAEKTA